MENMTIEAVLGTRPEVPIVTQAPVLSIKPAEAEKIERLVGNMSNPEKAVAVHKIPTEILQNEITRRIQRDKAALNQIKGIVDALERY